MSLPTWKDDSVQKSEIWEDHEILSIMWQSYVFDEIFGDLTATFGLVIQAGETK